MRDGMDATHFESLLFTHTHPDHFNVGELFSSRMEGYGFEINHPFYIFSVTIALSMAVLKYITRLYERAICISLLNPFRYGRKEMVIKLRRCLLIMRNGNFVMYIILKKTAKLFSMAMIRVGSQN